jgi:hypothetical protein
LFSLCLSLQGAVAPEQKKKPWQGAVAFLFAVLARGCCAGAKEKASARRWCVRIFRPCEACKAAAIQGMVVKDWIASLRSQ